MINNVCKYFVHNSFRSPVLSSIWRLNATHVCFTRHQTNSSNTEQTNIESIDIESLYVNENVQKILKRLTGFDLEKIFAKKPVEKITPPQYEFLTDRELEMRMEESRQRARSRLQMPPVLRPKDDQTEVLSKDPEIQGYFHQKILFIDVSVGYEDKERVIVAREPNGLLRTANKDERYRMNQIFFPKEERTLETPKMFEDEHFYKVLDRHDYVFALDRACLQFEPDDQQYIDITHKTYEHIAQSKQFECLRSTRFFGPMSFYYVCYKKIDDLLIHFILLEKIDDCVDLIKLYYIIHTKENLGVDLSVDNSTQIIKYYINEDSVKKYQLEIAIQKYEDVMRERQSILDDIDRAHGKQINN